MPELPVEVREANAPGARRRPATVFELAALQWFAVEDDRGEWAAVLGAREAYDMNGAEDVVEIVHVSGAARQSCALVVETVRYARRRGRAVTCEIAVTNARVARLLTRLGLAPVRVVWRARWV